MVQYQFFQVTCEEEQTEILFNEFKYVPAFAVSAILVLMAVAILVIRSVVEYRGKKEL